MNDFLGDLQEFSQINFSFQPGMSPFRRNSASAFLPGDTGDVRVGPGILLF